MYLINNCFPLKIIFIRFLILRDHPNMQFYYYLSNTLFKDTQNGFFCSLQFLGFTHSSLSHFQSIQFWFAFCIFLFILSYLSCAFLISFVLFWGGSFSFTMFMHQSLPIECNSNWRFPLWIVPLGSSTEISWNKHFIVSKYILEHYR